MIPGPWFQHPGDVAGLSASDRGNGSMLDTVA